MTKENQQIIAQLHEKRGEIKQFIFVYSLCAVVALIASVVFFCLKEISAGVALLCAFSMTLNNAISQKECYDYCKCLIEALTLIDILADRAGIDPDEVEQQASES